LAEELISEFGDQVDSITLVRGSGGRFEVSVDGDMVFSKGEVKRHAQPGEIVQAIKGRMGSERDLRKMVD
jgi:selenoprotein W-related protein